MLFQFRGLISAALICCAFLGSMAPASAGTTGGLTGRIIDGQTHAPIAGAKVSILSASGGTTTTTNAQGSYAFVSLTPDTYVLTDRSLGISNALAPRHHGSG